MTGKTTSDTPTPDDPQRATRKPTPPERDETVDREARHQGSDTESMEQAHRDVESGLQDTERIGTPNDVPSSKSSR